MEFQAEKIIELPPELRKQFDQLEKRLWRVDTAIAICGSLAGFLASYLTLFILDRFWDTPPIIRAIISLCGIATILYFTTFWMKNWVFRRRNIESMARIVQKHYRKLGDRLLGIVELAENGKSQKNASPGLIKAAIRQVASEAVKYDFKAAVSLRKTKIYFLLSLSLLIIGSIPFLLVPQAGANALNRWIMPFSGISRFTFVNIEGLPNKLFVPHGEPFEIECGIKHHPLWKPAKASCIYNDQYHQKGIISENKVVFKIPGVTQKGNLKIRIGDISRQMEVEPVYRPQLKQLLADVELPAYLKNPSTKITSQGGRLSVLSGSKISIVGEFTREIVKVMTQNTSSASNTQSLIVNTNGEKVYFGSFGVDNNIVLNVNWVDRFGLTPKSPFNIEITATRDAPPIIEIQNLPRQVAILEDEVLPIKIVAKDDYGVKNIGIALEFLLPQEEKPLKGSYVITNGNYTLTKLDGIYHLAPSMHELPPGTLITFWGTGLDYFPGRTESLSPQHRVYVLSKEEHAKYILEQFEKIRSAIEELTRRQESLVGETKQTMAKPPEKLMNAETAKEIGEQSGEQKDYAKQLERLAQETARVLKEAMRNSALPENLLKDWAKNAAEMQEISNQQMEQAANALNSAQQAQNQSQRSENLQKGAQKETEALESLQALQQKMARHLDKLQIKGLALRFKKLAEIEKNVGDTLKTNLPKLIGLRTNQVEAKVLRTLFLMNQEQELASKETAKLQSEVERFYQRTEEQKYGIVVDEMKKTQVADELQKIAEKIKDNVVAQAVQNTYRWSDQFLEWAKRLEENNEDNGSSGNGNSNQEQMNELDLEQLMALLRIRDEQEALIDRTTILDRRKNEIKNYEREATRLAFKQTDLREGLEALLTARIVAKVKPRLTQASDAMNEAEMNLRKPDTGKTVVNSQTDALNLLDDAIQQIFKSGQCKNPGANTLSQMMMNMGQGQQAGGNIAGNATHGGKKGDGTDPRGGGTQDRAVEKTSGLRNRQLPIEFREALQDYFNAIEQITP
ncbi:MAG: hypothetical protein N2487_03695 [Verrucomicrobiae bacterium]|nr:hypothetical protein [Verrucomicrobiae bacterium]